MKLIIENWRSFINEEVEQPQTIKTFGDLKEILKQVHIYYKAVEAGKIGKDVAIDAVENIINTFTGGASGFAKDIVSNAVKVRKLSNIAFAAKLPEEETIASPLLSMFNIDDDYSKMLDDKLENSFINYLQKLIVKIPNETPLEDFDINAQLESFIKQKFNISCKDVDGEETRTAKQIKIDTVKTQGVKTAKSGVKGLAKGLVTAPIGLN